jgi:hypothetical protein
MSPYCGPGDNGNLGPRNPLINLSLSPKGVFTSKDDIYPTVYGIVSVPTRAVQHRSIKFAEIQLAPHT